MRVKSHCHRFCRRTPETNTPSAARKSLSVRFSELRMFSALVAFLFLHIAASPAFSATYFVDFSTGNDSNSGTLSSSPWKHSPGDANATGNALRTLSAGDVVVFKGGVQYDGQINVNASGSSGNPITFLSGDRANPVWGFGRGIIDGGNTRMFGFAVGSRSWVDIEGLEIRNQGAPTAHAAGVDYEGGDNNRVRYCTIHDVNWSGSYVIGYGIENNHGANHTYEYNTVYNITDKLIETYGGGGRGTNDANHNIIRYNVLHDSAVHGVVLTSDDDQFYGNIIWQVNNGVRAGSPNPGYCLKIDQGSRNVIYNNLCYSTSSGWGVLVGDNNKFYSNTVYNVGGNGSGMHGSRDEVCIALYDNNSSTGWSIPRVVGNEFKNNLCDFLAGSGSASDLFVFLSFLSGGDRGTGNLIQNNHFFKASGDTRSTTPRVRRGPDSALVYGSIADLEANFNIWENGSGNVASGNTVGDTLFSGGAFNAVGSLPTGFNTGTTTPNATGLTPTSSAVTTGGLTLGSPYNVDITGATRTNDSRGAYELVAGPVPAAPTNVRIIR